MNIFVLSQKQKLCARYYHDKHVNKMILESAQMLIAAIRYSRGEPGLLLRNIQGENQLVPYPWVLHELGEDCNKPRTYITSKGQMNHPSTIWARESMSNFRWLHCLMKELNNEMHYRYDWPKEKNHAAFIEIRRLLVPGYEPLLEQRKITPFAQAMPDQYKNRNPIQAYRTYYVAEKVEAATWTKRQPPKWIMNPRYAL